MSSRYERVTVGVNEYHSDAVVATPAWTGSPASADPAPRKSLAARVDAGSTVHEDANASLADDWFT